jgi:hypothetical protein
LLLNDRFLRACLGEAVDQTPLEDTFLNTTPHVLKPEAFSGSLKILLMLLR